MIIINVVFQILGRRMSRGREKLEVIQEAQQVVAGRLPAAHRGVVWLRCDGGGLLPREGQTCRVFSTEKKEQQWPVIGLRLLQVAFLPSSSRSLVGSAEPADCGQPLQLSQLQQYQANLPKRGCSASGSTTVGSRSMGVRCWSPSSTTTTSCSCLLYTSPSPRDS